MNNYLPLSIVLALHAAGTFCRAEEQPDPRTLLEGVQAVRLQIPPSRLEMSASIQNSLSTNERLMVVEFDGDRRRFARKGAELQVRSVFNGNEVIHFDGSQSVTIRDIKDSTSDYFFDPRLLGITTTYQWRESVQSVMPISNSMIELVGREQIGEYMTWHVRIRDAHGQDIELWIDPDNDFRVYRYDLSLPDVKRNTTLSFYSNPQYPWLPSRVESRNYRANGQLTLTRVLSIVNAEAGIEFPDSRWSLAGLSLPIGVPVGDLRTKQRLGYWNGIELADNPGPPPIRPTGGRGSVIFFGVIAGFPVGFLLLYWLIRRRTLSTNSRHHA
jgi:hypothetical protein